MMIADLEDSRDITRSSSTVRQLNNALSSRVRQGSPVDENAAQLIDPAVTFKHTPVAPHLTPKHGQGTRVSFISTAG